MAVLLAHVGLFVCVCWLFGRAVQPQVPVGTPGAVGAVCVCVLFVACESTGVCVLPAVRLLCVVVDTGG